MQRLSPTLLIASLLVAGCSEYNVESIEDDDPDWFEQVDQRPSPGSSTSEDDGDDGQEDDSDRDDDRYPPADGEDDREDDREDDSDDDDDTEDRWGDDGDDDTEDDTEEDWDDDSDDGYGGPDDEDTDDSSDRPGESRDTAREPWPGEMVFTELMIDPESSPDRLGEWVEIRNTSGSWVDLSHHFLADSGVDNVEMQPVSSGSLVVAPGGYAVICAEADYWDNGGVDCDGTFRYWTLGDGFAMSNTEDEALLISPDGLILDVVAWNEGFAAVGSAMGVEASAISVDDNDFLDRWCDQWSWLALGDAGTPGEVNDSCW